VQFDVTSVSALFCCTSRWLLLQIVFVRREGFFNLLKILEGVERSGRGWVGVEVVGKGALHNVEGGCKPDAMRARPASKLTVALAGSKDSVIASRSMTGLQLLN
jgi:hypothetical protein